MTDETPDRPIPGTPGTPGAPDSPTPGAAAPGTPASEIPASGTPASGASAPGASVPGTPARPAADVRPVDRSVTPTPDTVKAGNAGTGYTPPPPKRTSAQIRADIEAQRAELGNSVDHLRDKVTELTDWRGQIRKHRKKIVVGAVATGFVVGGLMALRRR